MGFNGPRLVANSRTILRNARSGRGTLSKKRKKDIFLFLERIKKGRGNPGRVYELTIRVSKPEGGGRGILVEGEICVAEKKRGGDRLFGPERPPGEIAK